MHQSTTHLAVRIVIGTTLYSMGGQLEANERATHVMTNGRIGQDCSTPGCYCFVTAWSNYVGHRPKSDVTADLSFIPDWIHRPGAYYSWKRRVPQGTTVEQATTILFDAFWALQGSVAELVAADGRACAELHACAEAYRSERSSQSKALDALGYTREHGENRGRQMFTRVHRFNAPIPASDRERVERLVLALSGTYISRVEKWTEDGALITFHDDFCD
jgi:hypothetical protein